jgi:hypothetical protein
MPADIDQIRCPALLITGDADQTAPRSKVVFWPRRSLGRDYPSIPYRAYDPARKASGGDSKPC